MYETVPPLGRFLFWVKGTFFVPDIKEEFSMASSKHTTQYQLNQWQAGDPVLREDFNSDNLKLENALAALAAALNTKAGSDQLTAVAQTVPKVAVGSYVGDGAASKSIALPFTPKAVYACPVHGGTLWIPEGSGNGTTYTYGGLAVTGQNAMTWRGGHDVVAIQTGGFTVYYSYYSNEFMYAAANMSGQTYVYVAIG